jgi:hypothetical protein
MRVHAPARSQWSSDEAGFGSPPYGARLVAPVRDP